MVIFGGEIAPEVISNDSGVQLWVIEGRLLVRTVENILVILGLGSTLLQRVLVKTVDIIYALLGVLGGQFADVLHVVEEIMLWRERSVGE